jgi:hypothetical protein
MGDISISEGKWTTSVYSLMRETKYAEVIQILQQQLANFPGNRAALSLLGYCYYYLQDYGNASNWYILIAISSEIITAVTTNWQKETRTSWNTKLC